MTNPTPSDRATRQRAAVRRPATVAKKKAVKVTLPKVEFVKEKGE